MSQSKKVSIIALIAIMISSFSLFLSYASLSTTLDLNGRATVVEVSEKADVKIMSVSEGKISNSLDSFVNAPTFSDNKLYFGVSLSEVGSIGEFSFEVKNSGNKEAIVKEIKVTGLDNFTDFVNVNIEGLSVGNKIGAGIEFKNVKVVVSCLNQYFVDEVPSAIVIDKIGIEIVTE